MKSIPPLTSTLILLITSLSYPQQRQLTLESPQSEQRVALVIGNSSYETAPLKNPVNDAQDIAQALRGLGFEVIYRENLDQNGMKRAIRAFGEKIRQGGVSLFYYAGHGVQVKGENYLVPIGAKVESEEDIEYEGVNAGFVLAQMESARNSTNIVILDACRNNPFARSFRSESRGLAVMDAPSGTLIAYATAPGSVASDGSARNGIYTQELLRFMRTPNLGIEEVFKKVRISVRNLTQGRQTPWEASSLVGDFYFIKGNQPSSAAVMLSSPPPVDPAAIELSYWDSIKNSNNPGDFKAYLREYPNGKFITTAKDRLSELETAERERNEAERIKRETDGNLKQTRVFKAFRGSVRGILYISPAGIELKDKDKPKNNLSLSCSEVISAKVVNKWAFSTGIGVEIKTTKRKDAYKFDTNSNEEAAQTIRDLCKVGY